MSLYGQPKDTVDINGGIQLFRTTTGHLRVTDRDGATWTLDGPDAVERMFYTIKGKFPEPPRICSPDEAVKRQQAKAEADAKKAEEEKNTAVVTMGDGTKRRINVQHLVSN